MNYLSIIPPRKPLFTLLLATVAFASGVASANENPEEVLSPSVINSHAGTDFANFSTELSERLAKWTEYTEPRRFLQHLQVQMAHASSMASKLGGMEALFELIPDSEMRIFALKQMHMHYTDAYDDLSLRWETTQHIVDKRPDLGFQIMVDVQDAIKPYMNDWVAPRLAAFEAEIRKIEPDYSLDVTWSTSTVFPSEGAQSEETATAADSNSPETPASTEEKPVSTDEDPNAFESSASAPVAKVPPTSPPSKEERTWESRDGKQVSGSFVRFVDAETVLLTVGGRRFPLKISKLSDADKHFLGVPPIQFSDDSVAVSGDKDSSTKSDSGSRSSSTTTRSGIALRDLGIISRPRNPAPLVPSSDGIHSGSTSYSPSEAARREMQRYQQHMDRTMAPRW